MRRDDRASTALTPRPPRAILLTLLVAVLLAIATGCGRPAPRASPEELERFRELAGSLAAVDTARATPRGRYAKQRVRLRGTTGLVAGGWVLAPRDAPERLPAVLLEDGREEDAGVIERLPAEFGDVVVLSLDYPAAIPFTIRLTDVMRRGDEIERAARTIPASFILGASYLAARHDVDGARLALTATSFAVPFATIAAATDRRFAEVALIYGAGDLTSVLAANLGRGPAALRGIAARLALHRFAALAPERFIPLIAPRPVVMINGVDDPQMPAAAVRRLYDAARAPRTLIWLRTGHLMPTDSALIRALVDTAFSRLAVLGHPGPAPERPAVQGPPARPAPSPPPER